MWHCSRDMRALLFGAPSMILVSLGVAWFVTDHWNTFEAPQVTLSETRIEVSEPFAPDTMLEVRPMLPDGPGPPLMGTSVSEGSSLTFTPALPLPSGRVYQLQWTALSGERRTYIDQLPATATPRPTVSLLPQGVPLPSNALKLYLHFTQPMEQGVFLERLRLIDASGKEVSGPFRETELWSPDGKRLTVWFHPGRQKTGVNLNVDEGPVLREGESYTLHVAGTWRSEAGIPLGTDVTFPFIVGKVDHTCPSLTNWKLELPPSSSREALRVIFDESLDPAMLTSALKIQSLKTGEDLTLDVTVDQGGLIWSGRPRTLWTAGDYVLHADPLLEDSAGNSLLKPFEVDLLDHQGAPDITVQSRSFTLQ